MGYTDETPSTKKEAFSVFRNCFTWSTGFRCPLPPTCRQYIYFCSLYSCFVSLYSHKLHRWKHYCMFSFDSLLLFNTIILRSIQVSMVLFLLYNSGINSIPPLDYSIISLSIFNGHLNFQVWRCYQKSNYKRLLTNLCIKIHLHVSHTNTLN